LRFGKLISGRFISRDEPGFALSAMAHVSVLAAGLLAFGASPKPFADAEEAIAVEIVDPSALNEVTRGERTAQAVQDAPRPRAERQSEIAEQRDPGEAKRDVPAPPTRPPQMQVAERNEAAPAPPPAPAPRPAPPREAARAEPEPPQPAPRPREAQRPEPTPEQSRQQLAALAAEAELQAQREKAAEEARAAARARAEAEARARAKAEADARAKARAETEAREAREAQEAAAREAREKAQADARAKAEADAKAKAAADARAKAAAEAKARRDAEQAARFNANDISKLLQSKEQAQSSGSSGREVNRVASLGTQTGASQRLNPSQRSQLIGIIKEQLERCWNVPVALQGAQKPPVPSVRVSLNQDGSLAGAPAVVNASSDPLFRVAADSALTATRRCAPLRIPAQFNPFYSDWRSIVVNFDARDVL
jgi:colicin import membrane protein